MIDIMIKSNRAVVFTARLLGLAMAGFLALFALDSFTPGTPLPSAIAATVIHLAPALAVLLVVAIGWYWPLAGALGFLAAAALYAWSAPRGRLDWVLAISGPLAIVGIAFLWSWGRTRARATPRA